MRIECPKDKTHNTFYGRAHVAETWIVDENADFMSVEEDDRETVHWPEEQEYFTCVTCAADAQTFDDGETISKERLKSLDSSINPVF